MQEGYAGAVADMQEGYAGAVADMQEGYAGAVADMQEGYAGAVADMQEGLYLHFSQLLLVRSYKCVKCTLEISICKALLRYKFLLFCTYLS